MYEGMDITPLAMELMIKLARSPDNEYFLRELARMTRRSPSGCGKALQALEKLGMVGRRQSGRNHYFRIADHPAIRSFKVFSNLLELNDVVASLKPFATKIILFGSTATGEDTEQSDIDLLVVTDEVVPTKQALNIQKDHRPLRPVIMTPGVLLLLKRRDRSYYNEMAKGIILWDGLKSDERAREMPEGPPLD